MPVRQARSVLSAPPEDADLALALAGAGELRGRKVALEMAQGGPVEPEPGEKKKDKKKHGH